MFEKYIHALKVSGSGSWVMVDVARIPGRGWEGAYAVFDSTPLDGDPDWEEYGMEDIELYGEELGCFGYWEIVGGYFRTPTAALKAVMKDIQKI